MSGNALQLEPKELHFGDVKLGQVCACGLQDQMMPGPAWLVACLWLGVDMGCAQAASNRGFVHCVIPTEVQLGRPERYAYSNVFDSRRRGL